jgi:hypothetical protein
MKREKQMTLNSPQGDAMFARKAGPMSMIAMAIAKSMESLTVMSFVMHVFALRPMVFATGRVNKLNNTEGVLKWTLIK